MDIITVRGVGVIRLNPTVRRDCAILAELIELTGINGIAPQFLIPGVMLSSSQVFIWLLVEPEQVGFLEEEIFLLRCGQEIVSCGKSQPDLRLLSSLGRLLAEFAIGIGEEYVAWSSFTEKGKRWCYLEVCGSRIATVDYATWTEAQLLYRVQRALLENRPQ